MQTLVDVGLGYVRSASRRPRCRAARRSGSSWPSELAKRSTGHTIYLLDEPTTGLHFEDVRRLLTVLHRLVDQGNTVLVIEHNLDVIKTADWIIDLGPRAARAAARSWPRARPSTCHRGGQLHRPVPPRVQPPAVVSPPTVGGLSRARERNPMQHRRHGRGGFR